MSYNFSTYRYSILNLINYENDNDEVVYITEGHYNHGDRTKYAFVAGKIVVTKTH